MSDKDEKGGEQNKRKPRLGMLKGQFLVPDDFNEMMQAEIEALFNGDPDASESTSHANTTDETRTREPPE